MKKLIFTLILAGLVFSAGAQHYNQYCNSLFSFCLDIPGNYVPYSASKTGDGKCFASGDGSMITVYGLPTNSDETLQKRYERELAALSGKKLLVRKANQPTIVRSELQDSCYTLVYLKNGMREHVYRRLQNNQWKNVELKCPASNTTDQEQVKRMIASLK